jgi:hypothetical protein
VMKQDIGTVKMKKMGLMKAAMAFNVPRSILTDYVNVQSCLLGYTAV